MSESDIRLCVDAGADSLGFVTEYPIAVPWNIDRTKARQLVAATPPFITTTAVVGGSVETILEIADRVRPHFLQLHGDETLEEIGRVCTSLKGTGIKVLKALRIDIDTGEAQFSIKDPVAASAVLAESGIAALVVDSKTAGRPAGTGTPLDWNVIQKVSAAVDLPLILAGGLTVRNVADAIRRIRPYAVDVISGVEKESGVKDARRVREFVRTVKQMRE
ncbi:MAG: phosphoribosylanthranilate isomerase [Desulfobacterales bacterium]|nr:phosphoribosylanthranilate isomerase [Desulfobacterales bacterium]